MAEDQNNKENTTTSDTNNTSEYEDVCYICRRPESVAGKMIHIQNDICICQDCMQKTFDTMNNGTFNMGDFMNMNMGKMPNISMINLADLQNAVPNKQKLKKKKPKDEQPISPKLPVILPSYTAPCDCAQSSTRYSPCFFVISQILSI